VCFCFSGNCEEGRQPVLVSHSNLSH